MGAIFLNQTTLGTIYAWIFWDITVAIGNPERHMRKASHCGSKQQ